MQQQALQQSGRVQYIDILHQEDIATKIWRGAGKADNAVGFGISRIDHQRDALRQHIPDLSRLISRDHGDVSNADVL